MRTFVSIAVMFTLSATAFTVQAAEPYLEAAMSSPARQADKAVDTMRHGAQVTEFSGVKPGQTVVDFIPGEGYWTRIFAGVVGPEGKVVDVWPHSLVAPGTAGEARMKSLTTDKSLTNVTAVPVELKALSLTTPIDVFFTSLNLHDLPTQYLGQMDITAFSREVLKSLKPGGRFVVVDHAGAAGTGTTQVETLHRIEPAAAKRAVLAAGFVFLGQSDVLANKADNHQLKVIDPAIKGRTDKFAYVFEKPTL